MQKYKINTLRMLYCYILGECCKDACPTKLVIGLVVYQNKFDVNENAPDVLALTFKMTFDIVLVYFKVLSSASSAAVIVLELYVVFLRGLCMVDACGSACDVANLLRDGGGCLMF